MDEFRTLLLYPTTYKFFGKKLVMIKDIINDKHIDNDYKC